MQIVCIYDLRCDFCAGSLHAITRARCVCVAALPLRLPAICRLRIFGFCRCVTDFLPFCLPPLRCAFSAYVTPLRCDFHGSFAACGTRTIHTAAVAHAAAFTAPYGTRGRFRWNFRDRCTRLPLVPLDRLLRSCDRSLHAFLVVTLPPLPLLPCSGCYVAWVPLFWFCICLLFAALRAVRLLHAACCRAIDRLCLPCDRLRAFAIAGTHIAIVRLPYCRRFYAVRTAPFLIRCRCRYARCAHCDRCRKNRSIVWVRCLPRLRCDRCRIRCTHALLPVIALLGTPHTRCHTVLAIVCRVSARRVAGCRVCFTRCCLLPLPLPIVARDRLRCCNRAPRLIVRTLRVAVPLLRGAVAGGCRYRFILDCCCGNRYLRCVALRVTFRCV